MKDNVEQYFAESNMESLFDFAGRRGVCPFNLGGHNHLQVGLAGTIVEEATFPDDDTPNRYGYLDFDPLKDGSYSLETEGASALDLDFNALVGSLTVRYLPVELLQVTAR